MPFLVQDSLDTAPNYWRVVQQTLTDGQQFYQQMFNDALGLNAQIQMFQEASVKSGGVVIISPRYVCLPVLLGNDGEPVPVYEIIEEWDALTDYDDLQERFPTLSYMQIAGVVAFIRKVMLFNAKRQDVDDLISRETEGNPDIQDAVRKSLADEEIARVLVADQ